MNAKFFQKNLVFLARDKLSFVVIGDQSTIPRRSAVPIKGCGEALGFLRSIAKAKENPAIPRHIKLVEHCLATQNSWHRLSG